MGLLSMFSSRKTRNDPAPERGRRSRTDAGTSASRRLAEDYADDTLDPDFPQKQRARRRLIGAVVLLAVAIIVLPIIFEHKPRPVSEDVAVKVANGQGQNQKPKVEARKADPLPPAPAARNDAALDAGEEIVSTPSSGNAGSGADKPRAESRPDSKADGRPDTKPETRVAEAKPATKAEKATDKAPDRATSGKYLILIGAFASEERAKNWLVKLKESKVPAYVEKKMVADGERNLLRAGPFSDRESAEAAEKRVRAIGLTSKLVEQ